MSLRHGILRTAVAVPTGTLAYGEAKEPGHIAKLAEEVGNLPAYGRIVENAGEYLSQHHNPTVAFLGLSAIAIAVNKGPLFTIPSFISTRLPRTKANTKSSKFVGQLPTAHRLSNVAIKSAEPKTRDIDEGDAFKHTTTTTTQQEDMVCSTGGSASWQDIEEILTATSISNTKL